MHSCWKFAYVYCRTQDTRQPPFYLPAAVDHDIEFIEFDDPVNADVAVGNLSVPSTVQNTLISRSFCGSADIRPLSIYC